MLLKVALNTTTPPFYDDWVVDLTRKVKRQDCFRCFKSEIRSLNYVIPVLDRFNQAMSPRDSTLVHKQTQQYMLGVVCYSLFPASVTNQY